MYARTFAISVGPTPAPRLYATGPSLASNARASRSKFGLLLSLSLLLSAPAVGFALSFFGFLKILRPTPSSLAEMGAAASLAGGWLWSACPPALFLSPPP